MKTLKIFIAILMLSIAGNVQAQLTKEQIKERKATMKMANEALKEKASKIARKEAKKYKKEGWMVSPGALPLEKQLDKSYLMQEQFDEDMFPKYIIGEGRSTGENYDAAKMQALELAKQNLAGQIQTEMNALIENTVSNSQMGAEEAASVTKMLSASKNKISARIGRIIPVVETYRKNSNKNVEVLIHIFYNSKMAKEAAKNAIREDLAKEGENLQKKLDEQLGW